MPSGSTDRFGFKTLGEGSSISEDSYKFSDADRQQIDRILAWFEHHHHTGVAGENTSPLAGPELDLDTEGGGISAGQRVRYRYTLVDAAGLETAASPESYVDTPEPVDTPNAPTPVVGVGVGNLIPGQYYYVLSAYQDFSTSETKAQNPAHVTVPATSNTNEITLTLPSLPFGATGFNIYRRKPGATRYFYLDSVDMDSPTPPTDYIDDGSVEDDCDRTVPVSNTTFQTNVVTVAVGGSTPSIPNGFTWKLYRTYESGNYDESLLAWIVEETFEGSGVITPTYDDVGAGTTDGSPPTANQTVDQPSKIDVTGAAEIQGILPAGRVAVAETVTFELAGLITVGPQPFVWVCEYDWFQIFSVRAILGRDDSPITDAVIINMYLFDPDAATPAWESLWPSGTFRARVNVGESIGQPYGIDNTVVMHPGGALSFDVDEIDGGQALENLRVQVFGYRQAGDVDSSLDLTGQ